MEPMTMMAIASAIAAIGRGFSSGGGASGDITGETAQGYGDPARGRELGVDPVTTLAKAFGNVENLGGILAGRAQQPVTLPGAFVQPTPSFYGGGMPMPIGLTGLDPGLLNPRLLASQGAQFPASGQGAWDPVAQPPPNMPQVGGGIPGLASALQTLGVEADPFGRWNVGGGNPFGGVPPGGGGGETRENVPLDDFQTPSGVYGTGPGQGSWQGPEQPGQETGGGPIWPDQPGSDLWGGERGGGWNPYEGMDDFRGMGPGFTNWGMSQYDPTEGGYRYNTEGWSNPFGGPPPPGPPPAPPAIRPPSGALRI